MLCSMTRLNALSQVTKLPSGVSLIELMARNNLVRPQSRSSGMQQKLRRTLWRLRNCGRRGNAYQRAVFGASPTTGLLAQRKQSPGNG